MTFDGRCGARSIFCIDVQDLRNPFCEIERESLMPVVLPLDDDDGDTLLSWLNQGAHGAPWTAPWNATGARVRLRGAERFGSPFALSSRIRATSRSLPPTRAHNVKEMRSVVSKLDA